jgi:hypothetical protein
MGRLDGAEAAEDVVRLSIDDIELWMGIHGLKTSLFTALNWSRADILSDEMIRLRISSGSRLSRKHPVHLNQLCEVQHVTPDPVEFPKPLLTKTTMTAAYAAQAPNISDLLAFVNSPTHKANAMVYAAMRPSFASSLVTK